MSENLLGFDTAAIEMQGVASLNNRCKDAVCHYELAWPPGERPTRQQWTDSALHTLKALGYEGHQFMIVAHDDKKHFHIHIMLNKVHMETLRAHTPNRDWLTLDAAVRFLEAKHGWAHTPGPMRWDEDTQQAVLQSKSERSASRSAQQHPTGAAAQFEHYQDQESFRSYVQREVAPRRMETAYAAQCHMGTSPFSSLQSPSPTRKGREGRVYRPCHRPQHPGKGVRRVPEQLRRKGQPTNHRGRTWGVETVFIIFSSDRSTYRSYPAS